MPNLWTPGPDEEMPEPMSRRARATVLAVIAAIVLGLSGLGLYLIASSGTAVPEFTDTGSAAPASSATGVMTVRRCRAPLTFPPSPPAGTLAAALDRLPVQSPDLRVEYTQKIRDTEYGDWRDDDCDGQDTRAEILARETRGGLIVDPYTGASLPASKIQIDHVVSVGDSWTTGGQNLTRAQRQALANDFRNTLAVSGHENQSKGDRAAGLGPVGYLPPLNACSYVSRQILVKTAYGLWVTPAERKGMRDVLATCPHAKLPVP